MKAALFVLALFAQRAEKVPAEMHARPDLPFAALARLAALGDTVVVLDARQGRLTAARVDVALGLRAALGARVRAPLSRSDLRLVRRLDPTLVDVEVPAGVDLQRLVADLEDAGTAMRRLRLASPPDARALATLRRLRPATLRFPLPPAGLGADAARSLERWPGGLEIEVDEGVTAAALAAVRWPSRARLYLAPRGNYLADATIEALGAVDAPVTVRVRLPLSTVEAAQLRRLRGLALEVAVPGTPREDELGVLRALLGGGPLPAADGGMRPRP